MADIRIHTTAMEDCATKWPSTVALKVPIMGSQPAAWRDVTFTQFKQDVEFVAAYWADKLEKHKTEGRPVVCVWLKGVSYMDLLHQWGIARAGFIPQLISLRMTDPTVVYQLLQKSKAIAIVHDESFSDILKDSPVPTWSANYILDDQEIRAKNLAVPDLWKPTSPDDTTMIFHTSGSTSGMPKLVPISASWNEYSLTKAAAMDAMLPSNSPQPTMVSIGSFSHMGSTMLFHQSFNKGGCYILASTIPYPKEELQLMIEEHGLNMLSMFPPALSSVLRHGRENPGFLKSLQKLEYLMYGGLGLDAADTAWAQEQGLVLVNVFGSTEVGIGLLSNGSTKTADLERLPGSKVELIPIEDEGLGEQLYELVVPPEARDCPDPSLRSAVDGKFHTGDLFAESSPGKYTFKGRNDDWIKMEMALRCDTGSIEKNAMATCGADLVETVVVVGVGRPSPTLIVEPQNADMDLDPNGADVKALREEIFKRITPFHQRRYIHERIDDPRFIMVMPRGTLPRTVTKGNVRRKQTEEAFQVQLNQIYAC